MSDISVRFIGGPMHCHILKAPAGVIDARGVWPVQVEDRSPDTPVTLLMDDGFNYDIRLIYDNHYGIPAGMSLADAVVLLWSSMSPDAPCSTKEYWGGRRA